MSESSEVKASLGASRVLLVEDDEVQREGLRATLREAGFRVCACSSAHEAIERFQAEAPEVAVLDLRLPDMDGVMLSEQLRALDPLLGVVIITMHPGVRSAVSAMRSGAADFIVKPVEPNHLLSSVRNALLRRDEALRHIELEKQLDVLNQVNADLNQFAGRVAHDLKSPVRASMLWIEFAREALARGELEDADKFLMSGLKSIAMGSSIIDGLLALSKSKLRSLCLARLSVEPIIQSVVESCRLEFGSSPFQVSLRVEGELKADAVLVGIALSNVIHNAFKYCSAKPKPLVDIVAAPTASGEYSILVHDNGVGVPADQVGRLFKPFERLSSGLAFAGEGIGLTTVKQVMDKHEGRVSIQSSPEDGTAVCLVFPARRPDGTAVVHALPQSESNDDDRERNPHAEDHDRGR